MLAFKETNEPVHKLHKSPTTLSSHQQGTTLNYRTNQLIPEKKLQTERKCNSFLSPTGYPTQIENKSAYSRDKAPNGEK